MPFAIGMGMVAYAVAVAFYTLLAIWRIHRAAKKLKAQQHRYANGKTLVPVEPAEAWLRVENRPVDKII